MRGGLARRGGVQRTGQPGAPLRRGGGSSRPMSGRPRPGYALGTAGETTYKTYLISTNAGMEGTTGLGARRAGSWDERPRVKHTLSAPHAPDLESTSHSAWIPSFRMPPPPPALSIVQAAS